MAFHGNNVLVMLDPTFEVPSKYSKAWLQEIEIWPGETYEANANAEAHQTLERFAGHYGQYGQRLVTRKLAGQLDSFYYNVQVPYFLAAQQRSAVYEIVVPANLRSYVANVVALHRMGPVPGQSAEDDFPRAIGIVEAYVDHENETLRNTALEMLAILNKKWVVPN